MNQAISHQEVIVPAMTAAELARAIAEPAKRAGHPLEDALVDRMVQDMAGQEGALPLLQFALTKLWEELSQESLRRRSPLQVYLDIGGIGGAVADRADKIFDGLKDDDGLKVVRQTTAQRIFLSLVQLGGENNRVTRRRIRVKDLTTRKITLEQVREVIHEFSKENARLITLSTVEGEVTAEVTHEALFETWQRFKDWIRDRWDDLRLQQRLEAAATYWDEQGRPAGLLWRSPDLDLLRNFVRTTNPDLNQCCLEFFRASERAERQQVLLRGAGVGALALLAAGMTWFGIQSRRAEQLALVRQLAAQAEQLVSQPRLTSQEVGALLAVYAFQKGSLTGRELGTVNQSLRQGLAQLPLKTLDHDSPLETLDLFARYVSNVRFSPNEQQVATASTSGTVQIWDAATGEIIANLEHHDRVNALSFSHNGQWLATASKDGMARVWNANTGTPIMTLNHDEAVNSVIFSPVSERLVTASSDRTAKVWNYAGDVIMTLNHDESVQAVNFSDDGEKVTSVSEDGTVRVWDSATGDLIATLNHNSTVTSVAFSDDRERVATVSEDDKARVWNAMTGGHVVTLNHIGVKAIALSTDGHLVATADESSMTKIWRAATGELIATLNHEKDDQYPGVTKVAFGDNGRVATARSNTVRIWSYTGRHIATFYHSNTVGALAFSSDYQRIATSSADGITRIWNTVMGDPITILNHDSNLKAAAFSNNYEQVATASWDGTVRVWNLTINDLPDTFQHRVRADSITFSADNQQLAIASTPGGIVVDRDRTMQDNDGNLRNNGTVYIWDIPTGDHIIIPTFHSEDDSIVPRGESRIQIINLFNRLNSVALGADDKQLATASNKRTAKIWDAATGNLIFTLSHADNVKAVVFNTDGKRLATASNDRTAKIWDAATGNLLSTLVHGGGVNAVAFSADGKRLATTSNDRTAKIWDAATGSLIATFNHNDTVDNVTFSADGEHIATVSERTLWVWNISTALPIANINPSTGVLDITFSSDSERIAAVGSDGATRIYWLWSKDLAKQICQRIHRNFSASEWINHLQKDLNQYGLTCANLPVHPTVLIAAHGLARSGNVRQSTALLRHLLRISQAAGHDLDLDPATEEIVQNPRAVARKYSAVHLVREATTLARNGEIARATHRFQQALDRDPTIDLNPSTDTLDQDPAAVAQALANPDN
ncbi:WD40 repeat domain-containing protein [Desulfonatronospira sp.]|uniref:WD40 repeat domain-containing protein n=1 Tax=Desulfonatronospira sp. TaxID=1962951 RepID=UPI00342482E3